MKYLPLGLAAGLAVAVGLAIGLGLVYLSGFFHPPFTHSRQQKVLKQVASYMNIKINPALLPPFVLKGSEVTNEYNNSVWGMDVGNKRSNIYDSKNNAIILYDKAKIHSLAHEYVHYFQHIYRHYDFTNDTGDWAEIEAIHIQKKFR